ncbi:hypothetical protein LEN26_017141 [Aphanomyces euteiches]|nr:hypothetical protein LEN26_017141 [Aphanomyces euteiches]
MNASLLLAMANATNLSPRQEQDIYDTAHQCANTISFAKLKNGPISWSLESTQGGYRLFKGVEPPLYGKSSSSGLFCSNVTINGTLEEVIEHFRIDSTEKAQELIQRTEDGALDSIKLASLPPPSNSPLETVIVKWIMGKTAFDGLSRRRDMCAVECDYRFEVNGRRAKMGYVRAEDRGSGHVFIESDRPGCLQAFHVVNFDIRGNATEWLAHTCFRNICAGLRDVDRLLREDRLSRGSWMSPRRYVSQDSVDSCQRCRSTFGLFQKKTNCQKCGKVVCSSCNLLWKVKVNEQVTKMNACGVCSLKPPRKAKKVDDDTDNAPWLSESFLSHTQTASASSYLEIATGQDTDDGFYYVL